MEHNAERRKTNVALCRGKHNAALFYHPNQDVRITVTLTLSVCWIMMDSNTPMFSSRDALNDRETPGFKDLDVNKLVTFDQTNIRQETEDGV